MAPATSLSSAGAKCLLGEDRSEQLVERFPACLAAKWGNESEGQDVSKTDACNSSSSLPASLPPCDLEMNSDPAAQCGEQQSLPSTRTITGERNEHLSFSTALCWDLLSVAS